MSKPLNIHSVVNSQYVIATNELGQPIVFATATVPSNTSAGYAAGALCIKLGTTDLDAALYINVGSATSCTFSPIQSA